MQCDTCPTEWYMSNGHWRLCACIKQVLIVWKLIFGYKMDTSSSGTIFKQLDARRHPCIALHCVLLLVNAGCLYKWHAQTIVDYDLCKTWVIMKFMVSSVLTLTLCVDWRRHDEVESYSDRWRQYIIPQRQFIIWTASSEFGTYRLCEQRRFRRACASAQSRQNLRCSLIQALSQEEPSDRKPDP